ncbi:DASH complex subunit dam1 [Sporothrix stenoceras]|uniref:DASH complex subunit DAM1 n=1 Tax=Sporothrix stenoceras TaxID=5173 RepID=A0ABR3YS32_9PEZI
MSSEPLGSSARQRSTSRTRTSRPTTPLRPSSRSSFRESARDSVLGDAHFPLNAFEPAFAELSDAMADLEANMMHFQLMHESLARFSESFASFMYGLNMNAYCVDFPEGPVSESFRRAKQRGEAATADHEMAGLAGDSEAGAGHCRFRPWVDSDTARWAGSARNARSSKHAWRPS